MSPITHEPVSVQLTGDTAGRLASVAVAWTRRDREVWTSGDVAAVLLSQAVADHTRR